MTTAASSTLVATLQNYTSLVENEAASMQGASNAALNLEDGSVLRAIIEADAGQALWLQYLVMLVLQVTRLATSVGSDADSFGADFGYTRLPAAPSTGSVTLSRFTSSVAAFIPVYIPATGTTAASGTQVLTGDGTQTFNVTASPTNANYVASPVEGYNVPIGTASITIPATAATPGSAGNVLPGTISLVVGGISGIDTVTNANAFTGGLDAETDINFRARFVNYVNSRTQATETAVDYAIQSLQQGISWTVQENVTANGTFTPGTFVVSIDDGSGNSPPSLVEAATTAVQAVRPIGSTAVVQAAQKVTANVVLTITVVSGANKNTIIGPVAAAITAFINALPVGALLPFYRIAQVAFDANASVNNVGGVTINGATSDIQPTQSQVVRAGTVVVN